MAELHFVAVILFTYIIASVGVGAVQECPYTEDPTTCEYVSNGECTNYEYDQQVRTVDCKSGENLSICCSSLNPSTKQRKAIEKWQQQVKDATTTIGHECTNRIACMLACTNSWKIRERLGCPEIIPDNITKTWEPVGAYMAGERLSCYRRNWTDKHDEMYTSQRDVCDLGCKAEFPGCERDKKTSLLAHYMIESSGIFNQLGTWFFASGNLVQKDLEDNASQSKSTAIVVRDAFQTLLVRMSQLDADFRQWVQDDIIPNPGSHQQCKYVNRDNLRSTLSLCWDGFVVRQNGTDHQLVEAVHESLDYAQFRGIMNNINGTLATYDFGGDVLAGSGATRADFGVIILSVLFVSIMHPLLTAEAR